MYDLVSLGEVMLRLAPPANERLRRAASLDVRVCGAQFNVAANLAHLGRRTAFLTKLPDNELGLLARGHCQSFGVDLSHAITVPNYRIGVVYVEFAPEPRQSLHIYDRQLSAATTITPTDFDWPAVLEGSRLAYVDGIFFALSASCREATLEFVRTARRAGAKVCFDMNYREAIWSPEEARRGYPCILPHVDVLVTNRWVSQILFGCSEHDEALLGRYGSEFGCATVCLTERHMDGGQRGRWKSIALNEGAIRRTGDVEFSVVDRFGTGDAFFAGFLHGYLEGDIDFALAFGNALCALAHTVPGDVAQVSAGEVMSLIEHGGEATQLKR